MTDGKAYIVTGCVSQAIKDHIMEAHILKHYSYDLFMVHMTPTTDGIVAEITTLEDNKFVRVYKHLPSGGYYEEIQAPGNDR